jgi:hypothetical protein
MSGQRVDRIFSAVVSNVCWWPKSVNEKLVYCCVELSLQWHCDGVLVMRSAPHKAQILWLTYGEARVKYVRPPRSPAFCCVPVRRQLGGRCEKTINNKIISLAYVMIGLRFGLSLKWE